MRCKATVERASMLYPTDIEQGEYTMNHVQGCSHGCKYPCYAMVMAEQRGAVHSYEEWCSPVLVSNTLELLDDEIPRLKNSISRVEISLATDAFMYGYEDIAELSIKSIERLNAADIPCLVLTKGVLPGELASLSKRNVYGISLVSLDEGYRDSYEPGSAPFLDRVSALRRLHDQGCRVWVNIEPYPTPDIVEQDLLPILESVSFADRIIFGRISGGSTGAPFPDVGRWYEARARELMGFCTMVETEHYIKKTPGAVTTAWDPSW